MSNPSRLAASLFSLSLLLSIGTSSCPPAQAAGLIYKYIDDKGVPTFTEEWDGIPERYRGRVQALDPETMQPLKAGDVVSAGGSAVKSAAASPAPPAPSEPSALSGALDRAGGFRIPLPSNYQFGIGLTTLLLVVMVVMMIRFNSNPAVKFLLKMVIAVLVGGAMYAMYFSGLNEHVAQVTGQAANPSVSGKELLDSAKGSATGLAGTIQKTAIAPLQSTLEKTKDATVGEALRSVSAANKSTQQMQGTLSQIDPQPSPDKH